MAADGGNESGAKVAWWLTPFSGSTHVEAPNEERPINFAASCCDLCCSSVRPASAKRISRLRWAAPWSKPATRCSSPARRRCSRRSPKRKPKGSSPIAALKTLCSRFLVRADARRFERHAAIQRTCSHSGSQAQRPYRSELRKPQCQLRHSESEADHIAAILKDLPECRADEDAIRQPTEEPERRGVIHTILHHRASAIGLKCVFVPPEAVRDLLLKSGKASARLPRGDARAPTNRQRTDAHAIVD